MNKFTDNAKFTRFYFDFLSKREKRALLSAYLTTILLKRTRPTIK